MAKGSWGSIACDHEGSAVMADGGSIDILHDVQCEKMVACQMALEAASAHGMTRIIVEMDCSSLASALKSTALDQALAGV